MNATMSLEKIEHYPVMLNQILSIISPQHGGTFIDCTFGGGGYTKAILNYPETKVIALDRDIFAKQRADDILKKFPNRFKFFHSKFSNLGKILKKDLNPSAIIFDLGFSSYQIADNNRGFSFKSKGPLDMRMGINDFSALDVVNKLSKEQLAIIFKFLGEEKDGKKIASKIIKYRLKNKIKSSDELVFIIKEAKKKFGKIKINPATKTFQALRVFVNKELTELNNGLIEATRILHKGGILIVVNFNSLEDKITKSFFRFYSDVNKNISRYFPQNENEKNLILFDLEEKKALRPNKDEIKKNIRSRSAKLRYAVRNENDFFYPNEIQKKFYKYFEIEESIL